MSIEDFTTLARCRAAVMDYYAALDRREHGSVAQARAFRSIEQALGMQWPQYAQPVRDEWPKLDKPARVGNGTFGVNVSARLVVEAAQRLHQHEGERAAMTPEQRREVERARRELWDMMNGGPP